MSSNSAIEKDALEAAKLLVGRHPEIVQVPGIQGGRPIFSNSRLCLHVVIALLRMGESDKTLLRGYPRLRPDLLKWLRANI